MNKGGNKGVFTLLLLLLAGIVVGGFIGDYLGTIPALKWLRYSQDFGITSPLVLDLGVLKFQIALSIKFTISGIIGLIAALIAYRRL